MATLAVTRARAILAGLGAPVTPGGVAILVAWQACEGMPAYAHNPMATTDPSGASGVWNSAGVRIYPTEAAGIAATVKTLQNGRYPRIVAALGAGDPAAFIAARGEIETWGTGVGCLASRLGQAVPAGPIGAIGALAHRLPPWAPLAIVGIPIGAIIVADLRRL